MSAVTSIADATKAVADVVKQRTDLVNTPVMQENVAAAKRQEIRDDAREAVAEQDTEAVEKGLAE